MPIRIDYFESGGGSVVEASWAGAGVPRETIPQNVLHTTFPTQANQAPVLAAFGAQLSVVGSAVSLSVDASDPDGDPLIHSAVNLPPGLSISSGDGAITGSPTTAGEYSTTVTVSDGEDTDSETFLWTVNPPLSPPTHFLAAHRRQRDGFLHGGLSGGANPLYSWNFGDGSATSGNHNTPTISHTFAAPVATL